MESMNTKRIFIVGASILQLPAILKAKEMGLYVAVADMNPNAVGVPYADVFYNVSTIDEEGILESAADFCTDGIMTLCTDMPMRAVAHTCESLGLIGLEYKSAVAATDKGVMIKAFEASGVAHPKYAIISSYDDAISVAEKLKYPVITKPTDNSGSRGVMLVNSIDGFLKAIDYGFQNGRKGEAIVEEYMQGPEVSVEIMVVDGVAHVLQVTDKLTTGAPHFVETGHSQPSKLPISDLEDIRALAKKAAIAVGIKNGPAHAEIILTEEGPKMVEIGARMGGDCITTYLVPLSTGIDMTKATIQVALGEKPDIRPTSEMGSAIRYIQTGEGILESVLGIEDAETLPGVIHVEIVSQIGDKIGEIENSATRVGYVIAQGQTVEDAVKICEEALSKIKIVVK